jgi:diguanylate cyclase (GGDEF)-like protein
MGNTMKHSALQKFNYVLLCLLIAGFLTVLIGVVESGGRLFYSDIAGAQRALGGWNLVSGDAALQWVFLPQSYTTTDSVTLVAKLDELSVQQGVVNLLHCKTGPGKLTASIGGNIIYDCANAKVGLAAMADIMNDHYIPIKADDFGRPIYMTLSPQRGCDTVVLHSALLTTKAGALMSKVLENLWCICLDFIIMVAGLIMVLGYFAMLRHVHYPPMLWLGLFLGCYSLWNNTYANTLLKLFANQWLCYKLMYALVGLMGVLWLLFMFSLNKKRHGWLFNIMICLVLLNCISTILCSTFLPAVIGRDFLILDIIVVISIAVSMGVLLIDYLQHQDIGRFVALGMAGAAACVTVGIFNTFFGKGLYLSSIFNIGVLFLTICFTTGLVVSGIDALVLKSKMHALEMAAYRDQLTGCENRRAFDQKLETYRSEAYTGCLDGLAMAMFDSNNLKIVNDTYGHARGDRLIIDTAFALQRYLGKFGTIYRIGGDEFVLVCDKTDRCALGVALEAFDREANAKGEARIDVSWGVAYFKPELDPDPDSVLMRAEHRMYEYKKGCKL